MFIPSEIKKLIYTYFDHPLLLSLQYHDAHFTIHSPCTWKDIDKDEYEFNIQQCIVYCARNSHDDLIPKMSMEINNIPKTDMAKLMFIAAIGGENIKFAQNLLQYDQVPMTIVHACQVYDFGMIQSCLENLKNSHAFELDEKTRDCIVELKNSGDYDALKQVEKWVEFKKTRTTIGQSIYELCRYRDDFNGAYQLIKQYHHMTHYMSDFYKHVFFVLGYFCRDYKTILCFIETIKKDYDTNHSKDEICLQAFIRGIFGAIDLDAKYSSDFKCTRKIDYKVLIDLYEQREKYQISKFSSIVDFYYGLISLGKYDLVVESLKHNPLDALHTMHANETKCMQLWLYPAVLNYKDTSALQWVYNFLVKIDNRPTRRNLCLVLKAAMKVENVDAMTFLIQVAGARTFSPWMILKFRVFIKYMELASMKIQDMPLHKRNNMLIHSIKFAKVKLFNYILSHDHEIHLKHDLIASIFSKLAKHIQSFKMDHYINYHKMFNMVYKKFGTLIFHDWIHEHNNVPKIESDPLFVRFVKNESERAYILLSCSERK